MNNSKTNEDSVTGKLPVLYELIDKDGNRPGYVSLNVGPLAEAAARLWPDQEQDPDRTGAGWDIAIVGAE